ncbi:MAG: iron donor protein CyaY [Planctomycetes bacterium]|nr:iron donor protein CyaY [Planctomycetota bacterium]
MDSQQFRLLADQCFSRLSKAFDDVDPDDLDAMAGDGMLTLEFKDRSKFIISRQSGNHQIWVAAGARAWHYRHDDASGAWVDDKDGHDFYKNVAAIVSAKLGRPLSIN